MGGGWGGGSEWEEDDGVGSRRGKRRTGEDKGIWAGVRVRD